MTVKNVTVPDKINDSTALQNLINSVGNKPAKFIFNEDHKIDIVSLLRFYDFTELAGNDCTFELTDDASTKIFGAGIPIMAPKNDHSAQELIFHDFKYNGRRDHQAGVEAIYGEKPWGHDYQTLIRLGYYGCVSYTNAKNCEFYNIDFEDTLGDMVRCEGGTNIKVHDCTASRGGHDVVYLTVNGGEIYNLTVNLCVNAGARLKSSHNVKIHDNVLLGTKDAYSPGVEIGSDTKNWTMSGIEVYNNTIKNTLGPGIQIASSVKGDGKTLVHHNFLSGCGILPNKYSGVGGILIDGLPVDIYYNTVVNSHGYGIGAVGYDGVSSNSFTANVFRNIVTGTVRSAVVGTGSGSGIVNLYPSRCTLKCYENDVYGNLTNLYNVTNTNGMSKDPLFTSDYHLQSNSPCPTWGRYGDTQDENPVQDDITKLLISCKNCDVNDIVKNIPYSYKIYRGY
jgi:Disaggregatase related.